MPQDVLAAGLAWQADQLRANASQAVTYTRGVQSVQVQATFGMKLLKLDGGLGGSRVEWTDMDFLIHAADMTFDGIATITPQRGDVVLVPVGGTVESFEVLPYGERGEEPCWRWSNPHRTMMRIHTKNVDVEQFT